MEMVVVLLSSCETLPGVWALSGLCLGLGSLLQDKHGLTEAKEAGATMSWCMSCEERLGTGFVPLGEKEVKGRSHYSLQLSQRRAEKMETL